jgi:lipid-A-disaccharide synthase
MPPPQILISAGEASSDMYASRLAIALRERTGAQFFGMGGPRMRDAGVEILADYHEIAVVGITEVLHKIPSVVRVQNLLAREAARRHAALAILVDSPGTHLGVARRLNNLKIPVGYFIGPQIWAWRSGRVRIVRRRVKRMVVIFPFEEKLYRDAGVPVDFVGHPLIDTVKPAMARDEFIAGYNLDPSRPIVALLPGSRASEVDRNFPTILEACELLTRQMAPESSPQFVHAAASGIGSSTGAKVTVTRVEGATYDALAAADCAIVASGTATVEAALLGTPMVVVYRVARVTAAILRRMVLTKHFAMVNLIADRRVVTELMQDDFTPTAVATEVRHLLENPAARQEMKASLAQVRASLGSGGAIERAADVFAAMIPRP